MEYFDIDRTKDAALRLSTACGIVRMLVYYGGEDVTIEDIIDSRVMQNGEIKATIRWMKDADLITCDNRVTRRSDGSSKSQKRQVHVALGELLTPLMCIPYPGDAQVAENIGNFFMKHFPAEYPDAYAVLRAFGMKDREILTDGKLLTARERADLEKQKKAEEKAKKENSLEGHSMKKVTAEEIQRRKDLVTGWLRENGSATITQIGEGIGMTTTTVYNLISREMYDAGEVIRTVSGKQHLYDIPGRAPKTPVEDVHTIEPTVEPVKEKEPAKAVTDENDGMAFDEALVKMYTGKKVLISRASGNAYLVGDSGLKDLAHPDTPVQRFTAEEMAGRWEELTGLERCPHCGSDARVQSFPGKAEFWCECTDKDCGASTGHSEQISIAVKRWNKRW